VELDSENLNTVDNQLSNGTIEICVSRKKGRLLKNSLRASKLVAQTIEEEKAEDEFLILGDINLAMQDVTGLPMQLFKPG